MVDKLLIRHDYKGMIHNFKAIKLVRGTGREIRVIEFRASSSAAAMQLLLSRLARSDREYIVGESGLVIWLEGSKHCWAISPGIQPYHLYD